MLQLLQKLILMYLIWIVLFLAFMFAIPALSKGRDSSAQIPFAMWTYGIVFFILGMFTIGLYGLIRRKTVGYFYLNLAVLIITFFIIGYYIVKMLAV